MLYLVVNIGEGDVEIRVYPVRFHFGPRIRFMEYENSSKFRQFYVHMALRVWKRSLSTSLWHSGEMSNNSDWLWFHEWSQLPSINSLVGSSNQSPFTLQKSLLCWHQNFPYLDFWLDWGSISNLIMNFYVLLKSISI